MDKLLGAGITGNDTKKIGSMKNLSLFLLVAAFTYGPTATAQQQSTVFLGQAGSFGVLAGTTVTNTGPTVINGNLGVWPGTAITGFGPGVVNGTEDQGDVVAQHAQASLLVAYNDAKGRTTNPINEDAADLGGKTLTPGLYKSATTMAITGTLTLDGAGVYIFQVGSALNVAVGGSVVLSGGATADNVFWQVGSSATLGTSADFKGTIMALASVTLATGARLDGRALALNAAVTLDSNSVTIPIGSNTVIVVLPPPPRHRD